MIKTDHKITCVCATKNRPKLLRNSIKSYIQQTYPNKELLIISQSNPEINRIIKKQISEFNRPDIVFIEVNENMTLGEVRKCGSYEASGEIVCQWDDDDYCHPKRLSTQYAALIRDNSIISVYGSHLHFYKNTRELYYIDWSTERGEDWQRCLNGTMMFFKRIDNSCLEILENFPLSRADHGIEDMGFIKKSFLEYPYSIVPQGYQYVYIYHGDNISGERHHQDFIESKYVYTKEELYALKKHIAQSCEGLSSSVIKVMGLNGKAYTL